MTVRHIDNSATHSIKAACLGQCGIIILSCAAETERRDFWEICEERYQTRSTILTSQLPVARWHEQIGDPTAADGILDRLVHNAHRIEMRGDSMRKKRGAAQPAS
jgi:DNA replication protein DnaC